MLLLYGSLLHYMGKLAFLNFYGSIRTTIKAELIELVHIFAKNMLALDGVWFQSIEAKLGMDKR